MINKICSKCKLEKAEEFFHKNKSTKDGLNRECKQCRSEKTKVDYKKDPEKYKKRAKESNKKTSNKTRKYILNFLKQNPCNQCGISKPELLEFDHLRDKHFNISNAIRYLSTEKIIKEIEKCQVLCGNCHRIKTHKENNTWKYRMYKKENPTLDV